MTKQLLLGAYEVIAPTFLANSWRHPLARTEQYATLPYWQDIARQLDDGGFDFIFFAEALGYPMRDDGTVPEVVVREAVQFPVHDALYIASGLAATVERLGIVVTTSTTAGRPYLNARAFGTVDHLTAGRIGWNVVTSNMQAALIRLLGESEVTAHDARYDRAEEFLDLSLKLWEGGWGESSVPADKATGVFNDPEQVHWISHHGEHFDLEGYFPLSPSPQRTPVLFQAGTSSRGRDFAARYAECVFVDEREITTAREVVDDMRDRAEAQGRARDSVKLINGVSVIVGDTREEALELRRQLTAAPSREAMAALFLGWSGIDLMRFPLDETLDGVETEVGQTLLRLYQGTGLTVAEILDGLRETMGGFKVTGTAQEVAEELIRIADGTDLDGFLVEFTFGGTESYRDFCERVVPVLRERGYLPEEPHRGTLREMLTGSSTPRLPESHPGAGFRADAVGAVASQGR